MHSPARVSALCSMLSCAVLAGTFGLSTGSAARAQAQAQAQEPPGEMCWTPQQLQARARENEIRKFGSVRVNPFRSVPMAEGSEARTPRPGVIRRVHMPEGVRKVALTFDLCELPNEKAGYDGAIFDLLRREKVRATVFIGGQWMLSHHDRAEQVIADPLFEIANHTWGHRNLRLAPFARTREEIASTSYAFGLIRRNLMVRNCIDGDGRPLSRSLASKRMTLFRFPYGACNPASLDAVHRLGLIAVQWDISSGDPWVGQSVDAMVSAVVGKATPGSIVLFHANGRGWSTLKALPAIIAGLRKKQLELATVGELLATPGARPEYAEDCYDVRPGDTRIYDALAGRLEASIDSISATRPTSPEELSPLELGLPGEHSTPPTVPARPLRAQKPATSPAPATAR